MGNGVNISFARVGVLTATVICIARVRISITKHLRDYLLYVLLHYVYFTQLWNTCASMAIGADAIDGKLKYLRAYCKHVDM